MKKSRLFSKWLIIPGVLVAMVVVLTIGLTKAAFNDVETSNTSSITAWTSTNWTQTSQADFEAGALTNVSTTSSPGNVKLALTSSTLIVTNPPGTNTGSAWTNPANAYADAGGTATITSGAPSGNNVWGSYGFSTTADAISQVRVRYDAWATQPTVTLRAAGASATGTTTVTCNQPTGTAANDVLIAFIFDRSTTNAQSAAPTGWQARGYAWTSGRRFQVFTAVVGKNSLTGTSWTFTGLVTRSQGMIIGYYNADTTGYGGLDTTVSTRSNASGTYGTLGITTVTNNTMIIGAFGIIATGTTTWSAESCATIGALTEQFDAAYAGYCSIAVADKLLATAGATGASTATPSTANVNCGILLALKPTADYPQARVDVSWDGGTHWSSQQTQTLTGSETTYWYDVTSATTWTAAKLNATNLQVRVDAQTVGTVMTVNLDWLPVEVTYYNAIASQVLDTTVTGSQWDGIAWDSTLPSGTTLTFEVRAQDASFANNADSPSWTSIGGTSPVISGLPSGKYKQWRATLTPDGIRTSTPVLQEVRVYYYGP